MFWWTLFGTSISRKHGLSVLHARKRLSMLAIIISKAFYYPLQPYRELCLLCISPTGGPYWGVAAWGRPGLWSKQQWTCLVKLPNNESEGSGVGMHPYPLPMEAKKYVNCGIVAEPFPACCSHFRKALGGAPGLMQNFTPSVLGLGWHLGLHCRLVWDGTLSCIAAAMFHCISFFKMVHVPWTYIFCNIHYQDGGLNISSISTDKHWVVFTQK